MPKGNLIKVSFGKPSHRSSVDDSKTTELSPVFDLEKHRAMLNGDFVTNLWLETVCLIPSFNVIAIRFRMKHPEWFLKNFEAVRNHFGRVIAIKIDGRPEYKIVGSAEPRFAPESPDIMRIYFYIDSTDPIRKTEVLNETRIRLIF